MTVWQSKETVWDSLGIEQANEFSLMRYSDVAVNI